VLGLQHNKPQRGDTEFTKQIAEPAQVVDAVITSKFYFVKNRNQLQENL